MRRSFCILLCAAGCQPDVEPAPIRPTVVAAFNPTASPPVVPTPTDLAFMGGDGRHLNVPDLPGDSAAQRRFNAFLNTLDGFPTASIASTGFSAALAAATVNTPSSNNAGSVLVFDLTAGMALDSSQVTAVLQPDGVTVLVTPAQRWTTGHSFAVLLFGGSDPAGIQGAGGETAVASPTFFLLRAANPLVALCPDPINPACVCGDDVSECHSLVAGVDDATAQAAETQRRLLDPLLTQLVPPGRSRNDVILAWTFTITTAPETVFDPATGQIPFPNDILIDRTTGLVNLPIAPGDPMAALKMQLNTLDGFSTSAPVTTPIDLPMGAALDQASLVPGRTVALLNLDPRAGAPQAVFSTLSPPAGPIAVTPIDALQADQDKYAMYITSGATAGGQPIRPAPAMFLVTGPDPLFENGHSTVSVLDATQAAQLEQLRLAYQPLILLLGIPPGSIAALTVFTTQSVVRPLAAMAQFPAMEPLTTGVTVTTAADAATLAAKQSQLLFPTANLDALFLGTFTTEVVIDPTTGQIQFARTPVMPEVPQADTFAVVPPASATPMAIPFWLSLPKKRASPAGAPIVILQHGLGGWRGDMVIFADAFAKLGWAAIAFDAPVHGARSLCMTDDQCMGGCDQTTHQCNGGFVAMPASQDPLACSLEPISGSPLDCSPMASGAALVGNNLFLTRSVGQQYVLDASQLLRVIGAGAELPGSLDRSHVAFLGVSLGAIGGTLLQAVSPQPATAVLVTGGGHLFEIFSQGSLSTLLAPVLMAQNIQPGTPEFAQLQATADWILDAADPFTLGPVVFQRPVLPAAAVAQKHLILQVAGLDTTIPTQFQIDLARQLFGAAALDGDGHPLGRLADGSSFSTFFADATHGTFLNGMPAATAAAMRQQALTFIISSGTAQ